MPAVLVHGVPDTYRVWESVLTQLGREDVLIFPGGGHWFPLEQPEGFAEALRKHWS